MSKLEVILKYISEHNDYYKNIITKNGISIPENITQYPILTRQELQDNRYNMFSDGYKSKYFSQQLRRQSSSGSSGVPVNVYCDYKDWYASNLSLWRKRLHWYGIHPNDKYVLFTLNAFNLAPNESTLYYVNKPSNVIHVNVSLIQDDDGYNKLINIINEFAPKWIYIQPFVLNKLIVSYQRAGINPPQTLKYIESAGEYLSSDLRRRAIQFFDVPIANMYGSEEMNAIAFECPNHCMHIFEDNVYVEVKNDEGVFHFGEGEAIITNLNNMAMPLVRYNQKDKIITTKLQSPCRCGCSGAVIEIIKGRTSENLLVNNVEINSYMLTELIAEVNNQFNDIIREYKYVYSNKRQMLICYIRIHKDNELWFSNVRKMLISTIHNKFLHALPFQFDVCKYIHSDTNNKKKKILEIID